MNEMEYKKMICKVETERLIIRNFTPEDWRDLHEYFSDEQVLKFEPYRKIVKKKHYPGQRVIHFWLSP